MQDLIRNLHKFAEKNFPVPEISSYLKTYKLNNKDREKFTFFHDSFYTRNLVYKDEHFEILILCWGANQMAPIHGHEGEKCWARVETGKLQFCNYIIKSSLPLRIKMDGQVVGKPGYLDGPAEIHSVENIFKKPALSLHVYAKPFDACDIYNIKNQTVKRLTLDYHSKYGELC